MDDDLPASWTDPGAWSFDPPRANTTLVTQAAMLDAFLVGLGGRDRPIDPCADSFDFVNKYKLTIDRRPFDFDVKYSHLVDPYRDDHPRSVYQAGAQTGKTARLFVAICRFMALYWGSSFGYYAPNILLLLGFSRDRFRPFLRSNAQLGEMLGKAREGSPKGVENELTMTWGETILYFLTTAGRSSTEGLPMQGVFFDEVRRMEPSDVERAMKRYAAQEDPIDWKVSTAKIPEKDINHWFATGDERFFHSACRCADGIVLSKRFPDCILDLRNATPAMVRKAEAAYIAQNAPLYAMTDQQRLIYPPAAYFCPTCGTILVNPRRGWWEADKPENENLCHSWQMPELLLWTYPAGRSLLDYETAIDQTEVWNSLLGMPHLDPTQMPVREEHLWGCVDSSLAWGEHLTEAQRRRQLTNVAMGCDVQDGYGCAVLKCPDPSGRHRTVHLEVVEVRGDDQEQTWWYRLGQLMQRYDVRMAVIDHQPEFSAAELFARAFRGRVWLQDYSLADKSTRVLEWEDEALAKDTKAKGELKAYWRVQMQRTQILEWGAKRWVNRSNLVPDPRTLIQNLPQQKGHVLLSARLHAGTRTPTAIGLDPYFDHQRRWLFRDTYDDDPDAQRVGKTKRVAEWIGKDPHFAHADAWASAALTRITATG